MSLIGPVGRKRPRARIAMATLYLLLSLGAITTLYPFVLMVSTGLKGPTDQADTSIVPKYVTSDDELLTKYIDDRYAGDKFNIASNNTGSISSPVVVGAYRRFVEQLQPDYWQAGFRTAPNQVTSRLAVEYHKFLRKHYATIEKLNETYIEENVGFQTVDMPAEPFDLPKWQPTPGMKWLDWQHFKMSLPEEFRIPVRTRWLWQRFLAAKYKNQMASVPAEFTGRAKAFYELEVPNLSGSYPAPLAAVIQEFKSKQKPRFLENPVEDQWERFVGPNAEMPIRAADMAFLDANRSSTRREFAWRNYAYVLDYILLNGRAVWNTLLFCFLSIVTQLTVNPIAAYALSRYPIRASGKILMFLLATMAFPAEVAMIPSFLLLKDLGLLNTFAALVLPGAASGYMIFLLKGFFDSLPQELFEAGAIDGAKETTMMLRIAFPMSTPVLGYLALLAFMGSYGAFIYAFLVAQDQKIWTLMVWIFQLQNSAAPKAVIMAALTLAAVPTLAVFLCAQRVIMRGIVLPGEK